MQHSRLIVAGLVVWAMLVGTVPAPGQIPGGTGTTGTGGFSTGTGTTGMSGGLSGGLGSSQTGFLGTATTGSPFLESAVGTVGYGPGQLGHAAKAGNSNTTSNPLGAFYVNSMALGMPGTSSSGTGPTSQSVPAFGTALYSSLYTGTGTTGTSGSFTGTGGASSFGGTGGSGRFGGPTTGGVGGTTGVGGVGAGPLGVGRVGVGGTTPGIAQIGSTGIGGAGFGGTGLGGGFNPGLSGYGTTNGYRAPAAYTTAVGFKYKPTAPAQLQTDLRQVITRSSDLTGRNIQVDLEGTTVVLRGSVADSDQRRLAENLLRLQPGVKGVRNELVVEETPASKPGQ